MTCIQIQRKTISIANKKRDYFKKNNNENGHELFNREKQRPV